ncbi:MAG: DUF2780 domain-containing protein [Bdellovibrionota bacterium]
MIEHIIQELTKRLGLTEEQAKGGLGLLLKFCQEKLAQADFQKITELLGNQWQELVKAAPEASSNLMGKIGGLFSEKAGAMANMVGDFKKLGIDISKVQTFVDVTVKTLEEKGGPQVKAMLDKFLKV